MIDEKLFKTFKILLGKGRAFNLQSQNIENISRSFLKPFEELIRVFHRISFTTFTSENIYSNDLEKEQDIKNLETQFNISPSTKTTLNERAKNIETQFGIVGGQSWKYLENNIRNAGIPARVIENIPVRDLLSKNIIQYGKGTSQENQQHNQQEGKQNPLQYDCKDGEGNQYAMYGKSGYLVVGNGILKIKEIIKIINPETEEEIIMESIINKDPVEINNKLQNIFLIEHKDGGVLKITSGQLEILIDLILKIKPMEEVCLLNVNIQ